MSQIKVYRSGQLRPVLAVVFFVFLACVAGAMAQEKPWVGWSLGALFGGAALLALANVLVGAPKLTLGRKGFELTSLLKTTRIRWDEIAPPRVGTLRKTQVITVHYLPGHGEPTVSRAMTGTDLTIPATFKAPLPELCRTMNDYRDRYLAANPLSRPVPIAESVEIAEAA